jgi:hypothetical protein
MTHMDAGNAGNAGAVSSANKKRPILTLTSLNPNSAPIRGNYLKFSID